MFIGGWGVGKERGWPYNLALCRFLALGLGGFGLKLMKILQLPDNSEGIVCLLCAVTYLTLPEAAERWLFFW